MTQYPEAWLCRELGMAVVNISLITDYDAGVNEGTEAVDATSVLEVFEQNATRIQKVVLDLIGRFPVDLNALGARAALGPTRGDGHAMTPRGHPAVRDRAVARRRRPVGAACRSASACERSGPSRGWWLESARRLDAAGYEGLGVGPLHRPWRSDRPRRRELDALAMTAGATSRIHVGSFVAT